MANNIQLKDIVGKNKSYIAKISKDELVNLLHNGSKEGVGGSCGSESNP